MNKIQYLLDNSNLPGPRGNLKLLYEFAEDAADDEIDECLSYINPDVSNSPEEFVCMCGVLAYAVKHKDDTGRAAAFLREHANHGSWRIREAAAMGIQEIAGADTAALIDRLGDMINGTDLEKRAVVAGLCEPKLLGDEAADIRILGILFEMTRALSRETRLNDGAKVLRKALGYGWSVVICSAPAEGKRLFEKAAALPGSPPRWIVRENLKKNRLAKLDPLWTASMKTKIS